MFATSYGDYCSSCLTPEIAFEIALRMAEDALASNYPTNTCIELHAVKYVLDTRWPPKTPKPPKPPAAIPKPPAAESLDLTCDSIGYDYDDSFNPADGEG